MNLVDRHQGITIIPQLAVLNLKEEQMEKVREFSDPKPVREISLVALKTFPRKALVEKLKEEIISELPPECKDIKNKSILDI